MKQYEILNSFDKTNKIPFNPELFIRKDSDLTEALVKSIMSCQRFKFFTVKVLSITEIDNYEQIMRELYTYEQSKLDKKGKGKGNKNKNPYDYIELKDSDIRLLKIRYYIAIKGEGDYLDVLIVLPRIVKKFYYRISGNVYSAVNQIVDASTYNNSTSSSATKSPCVTLRTLTKPAKFYRYSDKKDLVIRTVDKTLIKCTNFVSEIFSKYVSAILYLLAKYGFTGTMRFLNIENVIHVTSSDIFDKENYYVFQKNSNVFISVPKMIFENDHVVQSIVYNLVKTNPKDFTVEDVYSSRFWVFVLGSHYSSQNQYEKGLSILDSVDWIYDIKTKETIYLPEEDKKDMYHIIKWIMCEFGALKLKDNLDVGMKRVRNADYIASLYTAKLADGIYRVSDGGKKSDVLSLKKAINIQPMYLMKEIVKCRLVSYRIMANDLDSMTALKFSYKDIETTKQKRKGGKKDVRQTGKQNIPDIHRRVHFSHIGRLDLDASSATDPGMTGSLCPFTTLYGNGNFSEFEESNSYKDQITKLIEAYQSAVGMKEVMVFKNEVLGCNEDTGAIDDALDFIGEQMVVMKRIEDTAEYVNHINLEPSGTITCEDEDLPDIEFEIEEDGD